MAQGFKAKATVKNVHKTTSSTTKKVQPKDMKKGARVCPPKKDVAVSRAIIHRVCNILLHLWLS